MKVHQVCARCVMDTTDPEISFDQHGICNHCTTYFTAASKEIFAGRGGEERLIALAERMKGEATGRDYDCIIGVSGGVDSTFVAYQVKRLGLRALAVHVDNGWNSALAVTNIQRTLNRLGIDLYTQVLDWDEFRDLQLAFLKASTPDLEIPTDHAIQAVLLQIAAKYRTRYIVAGSNFTTEGIMPRAWSQGIRDWKYINAVQRQYGREPLRTFPHFTLADFISFTVLRRIRFVYLLNYIPYVKADAMRTIERELNWTYYGGKHYESIYTRFVQAFILPRKFGFDKRRGHLSTLICSGQMTRDQALEELTLNPYPAELLEEDLIFVMKKLGLSAPEFDKIMQAEPKTFWDYPSYERSALFRPARALYRVIRHRELSRNMAGTGASGVANSRSAY